MKEIKITPCLPGATAVVRGMCAGGEHVVVRLVGCAPLATDTLRFRIVDGARDVAAFPLEEGDKFAVSGDDLKFELNLNTKAMLDALKAHRGVPMQFVLDDCGEARQMYFSVTRTVLYWPLRPRNDTPINLDDYAGRWNVRALLEKVEEAKNPLAGVSVSEKPTQRETAEAVKEAVVKLGGSVVNNGGIN